MSAPVSLYTLDVHKTPSSKERVKAYLAQCYEKLPFALPHAIAQKQIAEKSENFAEELLKESFDEAKTAKRKIR